MATASGHASQVTVTITADPASATGGADGTLDTASTLSLIYIYSESTSPSSDPTSTASSSRTSSNDNSSNRLGGGAIAGIVAGCIAFIAILSLALFCFSRHIARKKRYELNSLQQSRQTAESRAYSQATTNLGLGVSFGARRGGGGPNTNGRTTQNSHYPWSPGATPTAVPQQPLYTPDLMKRAVLPHELPELDATGRLHNNKAHKTPRTRPSKPALAEVYGSPVELLVGSETDLVAPMQDVRRAKGSSVTLDSYRRGHDRQSGAASGGYPSPGLPSSPRRVLSKDSGLFSDMDGTETEYGGDGATDSIHIYYRSSAADIAAAMSQASSIRRSRASTSTSTAR